ncbi:HAMP domain-containing protein [Streptomyces sp. SID10853]|uniref:nitrate- and nitrite sensing domain-containing protein n=1 Tax=Streptomyces sp. SID10853 TaxID=2706028 RepID=UPI0013C0D117|nr:HAMP domain-containing protein [Streptomyces sp. SID10853]
MQNKRLRGNRGVPPERTTRVRRRLVAGVAVVGLAVLAASAPSVYGAPAELTDAQHLVTLSNLDQQTVSLAHDLADERDDVTVYIAGGRAKKDKLAADRATRVDSDIEEIGTAAPAALRHDLATLPSVRRTALTGKSTALEANKAYSDLIDKVQQTSAQLADRTPPEAAAATRAVVDLGRAVGQASQTRGLLLGALAVPRPSATTVYDQATGTYVQQQGVAVGADGRTRDGLSAAAQQARVRELAALADFDQAADPADQESLASTVSGSEVSSAESYLARLAEQPTLSTADQQTDPAKLGTALSARTDQMRGVEASLAARQDKRLAALRDDAVTALELRIALAGVLFLLTVGVGAAVARTLTRPLAVLRIGAARLSGAPESEEPIVFTGRNDEFAQVVRSINALHSRVLTAGARADRLAGDHRDLQGGRDRFDAERAMLEADTAEVTAQLDRLRHTVRASFVNLSLRSLGLVERQLTVIEGLEEREQDPEALATLFKLDHMATVLRRHSENLLVLAGTEHGHGQAGGPVPLVDVLRASVSEIERYERVAIQALPPRSQVAGFAADDISHLVAELLENATAFSPPEAQVQLSGWLLENGEVMLSVQDEGIGMSPGRRTELNALLADPDASRPGAPGDEQSGLGLHVASLLAKRHGVRVELREQKQGGVAAVVVLPSALLPDEPPAAPPHFAPDAGSAPVLNLPGSMAEANSNTIPTRSRYEIGADTHERTADEVDEPTFTMRRPAPVTDPETAPEPGTVPEREPASDPMSGPGRAAAAPGPELGPEPSPDPDQDSAAGGVPVGGIPEQGAGRVTDKGLPKRVPKVTKPEGTAPKQRTGSVDAAALRRRLGGFHQGAKDGRKDVETEISEQRSDVVRTDDAGDSVEEARS